MPVFPFPLSAVIKLLDGSGVHLLGRWTPSKLRRNYFSHMTTYLPLSALGFLLSWRRQHLNQQKWKVPGRCRAAVSPEKPRCQAGVQKKDVVNGLRYIPLVWEIYPQISSKTLQEGAPRGLSWGLLFFSLLFMALDDCDRRRITGVSRYTHPPWCCCSGPLYSLSWAACNVVIEEIQAYVTVALVVR